MKYKIDILTKTEYETYYDYLKNNLGVNQIAEFWVRHNGTQAQVGAFSDTCQVFPVDYDYIYNVLPVVRFKAPEDYEFGDKFKIRVNDFNDVWHYLGNGLAVYNRLIFAMPYNSGPLTDNMTTKLDKELSQYWFDCNSGDRKEYKF